MGRGGPMRGPPPGAPMMGGPPPGAPMYAPRGPPPGLPPPGLPPPIRGPPPGVVGRPPPGHPPPGVPPHIGGPPPVSGPPPSRGPPPGLPPAGPPPVPGAHVNPAFFPPGSAPMVYHEVHVPHGLSEPEFEEIMSRNRYIPLDGNRFQIMETLILITGQCQALPLPEPSRTQRPGSTPPPSKRWSQQSP